MAGKLSLPPASKLYELGQKSLATALHCAVEARILAGRLKDQKVEGVDQRAVESFAVPAAMIGTAIKWEGVTPERLLREMASGAIDASDRIESDERTLIEDLLSAEIRMQSFSMTVAQAIEYVQEETHNDRNDWLKRLSAHGVKVVPGAGGTIAFAYTMTRRKLLSRTSWEGQSIDQYLRRINQVESKAVRIGSQVVRAAVFPLRWFRDEYMGVEDQKPLNDGF